MKKAFTLIELSIAMLILGLLISGVLVASKMVSSAKLRKIIKERDQLEQAIIDFKVQYGALPGSQKIYEDIASYPELGAVGNYVNYNFFTTNAYQTVLNNKNIILEHALRMTANGMLQMNRSSGGIFPNIKATSVPAFPTVDNIPQLSFNNIARIHMSYICAVCDVGDAPSRTMNLLQKSANGVSTIANINQVYGNIVSFLDKVVLTVSNGASNYNPTTPNPARQSAISVVDSIQISKKYDNGVPNGNKINFSSENNTTFCTTSSSYNFGDSGTDIGINTKFLINNNKSDPSKGCIAIFKTNIS
jgi:prepilin-type N-terminal cleavage/methylation domain-containing protein